MNINTIKAYEHNTLVSDILSKYLICKPELIIPVLVGDGQDTTYGLLEYWAEVNNTDPFNVLDAIEFSLRSVADFTFISTSPADTGGFPGPTANTILKLIDNIIIPLEWMLD